MTGLPPTPLRVLIADDEESMRHFLQRGLRRHGYQVDAVETGDAVLPHWSAGPYDAAILDLRMPGADGLTVLARLKTADPAAVVLLMTAHGTIATAVEAMQAGAADFVTKPFPIEELLLRLDRALAQRRLLQENVQLRARLQTPDDLGLVGHSAAMRALLQQLDVLRGSDATVMLTGESGTGKSLIARTLHALSARRDGPLVTLNCPAVPDNLVESELFGHEPGAFTGAVASKTGLCARAHRGTLFLDEVAEMSLPAQAKIERFLAEREFLPLGASKPVRVDVRIVAATNKDLGEAVAAGRFRAELLWRLQVVALPVPPLRERREDIPLLVAEHLRRLASRHGGQAPSLTTEAIGALTAYDWPGNVRELENLVERMVVMSGGRAVLAAADLPAEIRGTDADPDAPTDYEAARARFDRAYFTALLMRCGGSITAAAKRAGLSRGHLHRRLRELRTAVDVARDLDAAPDEPRRTGDP
ncbi:MAG: sigma-54-dependent Fis family transcriptional regulator [Planctomycetes bacterium]|nr:sigma-54-dependent Fis family transcriptional regulator [Planctomycetota bacterium]